MNNFDIKNFVLDKVQSFYWYEIECSVCGYKNSPDSFVHVCPICGKDLKVGEGHELVSTNCKEVKI